MCETFEHIGLGDIARPAIIKLLAGHETEYGPLINYLQTFDGMASLNGRLTREECFKLHNGAMVSYGDVLGLAGDYYQEWDDLDDTQLDPQNHDVKTKIDEVHGILVAAHDVMDKTPLTKQEAVRDREAEDPGGGWFAAHAPASPGGRSTILAKKNDTHFPPDGFRAWRKFHELAIATAIQGRKAKEIGSLDPTLENLPDALKTPAISGLVSALKINAFADHFLTDMFSSGHMRTPRARMRADYNMAQGIVTVSDILARLQHQEDGNQGLFCKFAMGGAQDVEGKSITNWYAMGDKQFADTRNATNRSICEAAVRRSIRDVILASVTGAYPTHSHRYWGKDPAPHATHSALQLIPHPLAPTDGFVASYSSREGKLHNSYPVARPEAGLENRAGGFLKMLSGTDSTYQDGNLVIRMKLGSPVGVTSNMFIDLKVQMGSWVARHGKTLGWSEEACEYAYLLKLFSQHGSDYKPEAA